MIKRDREIFKSSYLNLKDTVTLCVNGKYLQKKVSTWIAEEPLSLWKATKKEYSKPVMLAEVAYTLLHETIRKNHPDEYELNEKEKKQALAKKNVLKRLKEQKG